MIENTVTENVSVPLPLENEHAARLIRPQLAEKVIGWQLSQGRHDLPWQNTKDAYRIWLSEIMLQQTQVSSVIPYYQRFLERFPTIYSLAQAPVDDVLSLWAGLGYYARARNLHRCAITLVEQFNATFPADPIVLATLPGIGRSTASAISAFAYGTRAAILDGNVKRVFTRYFGIEGFPGLPKIERALWERAELELPEQQIESYTQGLMDLGATLCTRSRPHCLNCPLQATCVAFKTDRQSELPTPKPRKQIPEKKTHVALIYDGQQVLLKKRPPEGIWGGLLTLPELTIAESSALANQYGRLLQSTSLSPFRHTFTHFHLDIEATLFLIARNQTASTSEPWQWLPLQSANDAALPAPHRRLILSILSQPL